MIFVWKLEAEHLSTSVKATSQENKMILVPAALSNIWRSSWNLFQDCSSMKYSIHPHSLLFFISWNEVLTQWRLWDVVSKPWLASGDPSFGFSHACKTRCTFHEKFWWLRIFLLISPLHFRGCYEKVCWGRSGCDHFALCSDHLGLLQRFA